MDKIFDLGNVFNTSTSNFHPALLIPVVFAVICAVAVFLFGFQKAEGPKFRKISENSGSVKRKKRNAESENSPAAASKPAKAVAQTHTAAAKSGAKKDVNAPVASKSATDTLPKKSVATKPKAVAVAPAKESKSKDTPKGRNKVSAVEAVSDAGGEWQTVIPKKQKKQTDPLIQAVAEVAAVAVKKGSPKNKLTSPKIKRVEPEAPREEPTPSVPAASAASNEQVETTTAKPAAVYVSAVPTEAPASQIVFDELGDADWTETKPQKKHKKRALRE